MLPKLTDAVKHLIIINVIIFFGQELLKIDLSNIFALHYPKNEHFRIWQYISSMFLHADLRHLFSNMFMLWMIGSSLEQFWGKKKFLFFYFSAGIGAGLIYTFVNYFQFNSIYDQLINMGVSVSEIQNILTSGSYNEEIISLTNKKMIEFYSFYHASAVGASGAISGIFAASAIIFPNTIIRLFIFPVPLKNKHFMLALILSDLFLGLLSPPGDNIARFAHVGGAIIGFTIAKYWKKNSYV